MKLYHGSNTSIEAIDLGKCNLYKDFGQAFYLTEDRDQALVVAEARVSLFGGEPVVNEYEFDESAIQNVKLSFCRFDSYSEDWADFIFKHRDDSIVPPYMHDFDVVYGPIANDRVGMQIRNYRLGNIDKAEFIRRLEFMGDITLFHMEYIIGLCEFYHSLFTAKWFVHQELNILSLGLVKYRKIKLATNGNV